MPQQREKGFRKWEMDQHFIRTAWREAHKALPLRSYWQLVAVSFEIWQLVGCPCSSGFSYTYEYMGN